MFQQVSFDAPTSVPVRLTPLNVAVSSGPPIVIQYSAACCTVAPNGSPVMVIVPFDGAPARVARLTPSDVTPPFGRLKSAPGRRPVSEMRVEALSTRMRGRVRPLSASVTGLPVCCRWLSSVGTVALGASSFSTAHAPATCGAAIEVPSLEAKPPPGTDELIPVPGASSSTCDDEFEKLDTASPLVVEPTVIADEMHAGAPTPVEEPRFPDEITVAIPVERRLSIAALRASPSQAEVCSPAPRLMLTEAIRRLDRSAITR